MGRNLNLTFVLIGVVALAVIAVVALVAIDLSDATVKSDDTIGHILTIIVPTITSLLALLAIRQTNGKVNGLRDTLRESIEDRKALHEDVRTTHAQLVDQNALYRQLEEASQREIKLIEKIRELEEKHA